MQCNSCGSQNDGDSTFCESCGAPLGPKNHSDRSQGRARSSILHEPGPAEALLGLLKVVISFFTLPALSLVGVYRELAKVGAQKGAFSMESTPTPFLSWILIAMRMLVPVLAALWVIADTFLGLFLGGNQGVWGRPQHWWNSLGSHLGMGIGAFIGSLIGAFFFIWFANYCLDLLSIVLNLNQNVAEMARKMRHDESREQP